MNERIHIIMKKKGILLITMLLCSVLLFACNDNGERPEFASSGRSGEKIMEENTDINEAEKGYGLPVSDEEREEAESDCKRIMGLIADINKGAGKGSASNGTLSNEALYRITERIKETGSPVRINKVYSNIENYEKFEHFLSSCASGNCDDVVLYEIHLDGSIGREKYIYDGNDIYVVFDNFTWSDGGEPVVAYLSYTRIKEWRYTDKGWFCYKLCVPEYPEVTEIVDGSCLIRIRPMTDENRKMSEKCVLGLAYQGNNILCSDWDAEHMEDLDYNGMYEYLYAMKYQERFQEEDYLEGIPKEEFESLIMEYLPITAEEIQKYAVFDEEKQTYAWERLGCFNYNPTFFGTSVPEVVHIRENEDGTVTLTVDAVCQMVLCNDAVITHELTVQFAENGSFRYLGNKILNDEISDMPDYQYRIIPYQ